MLGENQCPFMNKKLSKVKTITITITADRRKQRSIIHNSKIDVYRSSEKDFDVNINEMLLTIKTFWETVKPGLAYKTMTQNKNKLTDKNILTTNEEKLAETLNILFTEIVMNLKIPEPLDDNQARPQT